MFAFIVQYACSHRPNGTRAAGRLGFKIAPGISLENVMPQSAAANKFPVSLRTLTICLSKSPPFFSTFYLAPFCIRTPSCHSSQRPVITLDSCGFGASFVLYTICVFATICTESSLPGTSLTARYRISATVRLSLTNASTISSETHLLTVPSVHAPSLNGRFFP